MKKILLLYAFVTCTALAQEYNPNSLRVITIESPQSVTDIIIQDTDQTKIDLFYYHNTSSNTHRLLLPDGIKDNAHMLSLVENQLKKVQADLTEAEKLEKDFNKVYSSSTNNSVELAIVITLAIAKSVTYTYFKPEILTKIKSVKTLKNQLSRLQAMKKLIADHSQ